MAILLFSLQVLIFLIFYGIYKRFLFNSGSLNISFLHYVYFFLFNYIGSVNLFIIGGGWNYKYLISVLIYPLVSIFGAISANCFSNKNKRSEYFYYLKEGKNKIRILFYLSVIVVLLYIFSLKEIPLLTLANGDYIGAAIERSLSTKEYGGVKAIYYLFRFVIEYLLIYFALLYFIKNKRINIKLIMIISLFSIICIVDLQKYPLLNFLLMIILGVVVIKASERNLLSAKYFINIKIMFFLLILYLSLGVLWGGFSGRLSSGGIIDIFETILDSSKVMVFDRLIMGQLRPLYAIYELIPSNYDYFLGATFPNPLRLFPFDNVQLSYLVFDFIHSNSSVDGIRGSAPTVYFSFVYANFAFAASLLSMYVLGFTMQYVDNKLKFHDEYIVPYRFMLMNYFAIFATSIDVFFMSEKFLLLVVIFHILYKRRKISILIIKIWVCIAMYVYFECI